MMADMVQAGSVPSSIIFLAPAPPSSAGWKMRRTVPLREASFAFRTLPAPSSIAMWESWPQACILPSFCNRGALSG